MIYHISLVYRPHIPSEQWVWLAQSPLKLIFVGTEAVMIFFVLSGLVLALPALKQSFAWLSYYPQRALRLYLPVFGSLVVAAILVLVVPRNPASVPAGSWMHDAQATSVSVQSLFSEASLMRVTYDLNNVLWSLRWELFFSLLLPVFVVAAKSLRSWAWPAVVTCVSLSVAGRVTNTDWMTYLPVFMLGTLIAVHLDGIVAWGNRQRSGFAWLLTALSAALLLAGSWFARPIFPAGSVGNRILWGLAAAGAALVIVLAIAWGRLRSALECRPVQWVGRVSFSLYLVHAPILGTLGFIFGDRFWWLVGPVGVPVSIAAAALFYRFVEFPTQQFSRSAVRSVSEMLRPSSTSPSH